MSVSLLFPARNRLEFTQQSWAALMANTDWNLVSEFHIYDDGSTDGTRDWLEFSYDCIYNELLIYGFQFKGQGSGVYYHRTAFHSPMGVTLDWIKQSKAPLLAKLDNDTIYPPGWLAVALDVMKRNPDLSALGLECMRKPVPFGEFDTPALGKRSYLPATFISGLGIYRRHIFADSLPHDNGYFGIEEWQTERHIKAGWILPSLPTILLDRLPIEPWASLSEQYVKAGWQRPWSLELRYKPEQHELWDWWKPV